MPRSRKSTNDENQGSQDLTSKTSRRKRTPSAEMSGLSQSNLSTKGKTTSSRRKQKNEDLNEFESPEKRRGYERDLVDDYYQEGARYASTPERGRTEFDYDMRHQQGMDPYWGDQREFERRSYTDRGYTSDYRNRRGGFDDRSEYMSGRGDVPSGGYYGYRRMEERYGSDYPGSGRYEDRSTDWNRGYDYPDHGSYRQESRGSRREPAYGGAWHSDYDEPRYSSGNPEERYRGRGYNEMRHRYGNQRKSGYDMYEERRSDRPSGYDEWQHWDDRESRMRESRGTGRRPGNYPGNY